MASAQTVAETQQSNAQINKARLEKLKASKAAAATAGKTADVPGVAAEKKVRVKAEKTVKPCKCGCGGQTTAFFVPGHDARFKGWLLKVEKGQMKVNELPEAVQKGYKWVKKGDGAIPTTNYKGEPHTGYISESEA